MPHLCKLGFEFAALPPNLARLLLGACPAAGLFLQSFRQLFALFVQFDFRLLQLIDPGLQSGLFGSGFLLVRPKLRLRLVQLLAQFRLLAFALRELVFQLTVALVNLARLLLSMLPALRLLGHLFAKASNLLFNGRLCCLQFLDARLHPALLSGRTLLVRFQLFPRPLAFLAQVRLDTLALRQFGLQFLLALGQSGCSLFRLFPPFGFSGQRLL